MADIPRLTIVLVPSVGMAVTGPVAVVAVRVRARCRLRPRRPLAMHPCVVEPYRLPTVAGRELHVAPAVRRDRVRRPRELCRARSETVGPATALVRHPEVTGGVDTGKVAADVARRGTEAAV